MFDNLHILLGVTGGIAAFKAVSLASKLTTAGAQVKTVMTEAACQLVGPKSFEAVTHSPVYTSMWTPSEQHEIDHIALADWANIVVVAPATADIIGKVVGGICDDLLSTILCACWAKPILFAPAMNQNMWTNPVVRRNVGALAELGAQFVGPVEGRLACGHEGIGRMAEPDDILKHIQQIASHVDR